MNKTISILLTASSLILGFATAQADDLPVPYQQITLSNGTTMKYTPDGTFTVTDAKGKSVPYPRANTYRALLTSAPYGAQLSAADLAKASAFAIDAPNANAKPGKMTQVTLSIPMSRENAAKVDQAMANHTGMSQADLNKLVGNALSKGKPVYYIDKEGRQRLAKDPTANSSTTQHSLSAYAFAGTSKRKGSATYGMGLLLDDKVAFEASCSNEGKQPDHIPNIDKVCDYDVVGFFPITDRLKIFAGAGVTRQAGTQKGATAYTQYQDSDHGANAEYGAEFEVTKNISIMVREEIADYPQINYDFRGKTHMNEIEGGNPISKNQLLGFVGAKFTVPLGHTAQAQASTD